MNSVFILKNSSPAGEATSLPTSKSISNRALILNALSGNQSVLKHLSSARDTQLMQQLVNSPDTTINVMDAGTTMRFLTAYFGISGQHKLITGTDRMKQRPISLLVNALRTLGVTIEYLENEGFPPIQTLGYTPNSTDSISIPGHISSQYISALMMVGPLLPGGLTLNLTGKVGSRPYIEMTAALMAEFGIAPELENNLIWIKPGKYKPTEYQVEADWSAASYWFAIVALAEEASITLPKVSPKSLQGDRVIVDIMKKLGVEASFNNEALHLTKGPHNNSLEWDFSNCPDLAQTVLPVCAAKGIHGKFTGLESLRIKESDRTAALQTELAKINAQLIEAEPNVWTLRPGNLTGLDQIKVDTYHDHRMAMGFAPLATLLNLTINDYGVVNKSYPDFWEDLRRVGFQLRIS